MGLLRDYVLAGVFVLSFIPLLSFGRNSEWFGESDVKDDVVYGIDPIGCFDNGGDGDYEGISAYFYIEKDSRRKDLVNLSFYDSLGNNGKGDGLYEGAVIQNFPTVFHKGEFVGQKTINKTEIYSFGRENGEKVLKRYKVKEEAFMEDSLVVLKDKIYERPDDGDWRKIFGDAFSRRLELIKNIPGEVNKRGFYNGKESKLSRLALAEFIRHSFVKE